MSEEFVEICVRYYLDVACHGFQDELLKNQKHITNWIGLAVLNLKSGLIPDWTSLGLLNGFKKMSVKEHQFVINRVRKEHQERKEALSQYQHQQQYPDIHGLSLDEHRHSGRAHSEIPTPSSTSGDGNILRFNLGVNPEIRSSTNSETKHSSEPRNRHGIRRRDPFGVRATNSIPMDREILIYEQLIERAITRAVQD
ncbi:hypothetical protein GE061_008181 [Apolygus lucorum]|uniref:RNA-directed RNA polymerase N-terminal domain-containing protein n=1 Tax=Apolygus lucorum TaxID=248454 RepID=A0A6A4IR63_APOLU|nr:hypothetical protein GE061_008177 [Apolygus lucorum]KAF6198430.1 hypothetical protein GE061_008178 [Apolygus lucorum]KAF6198431.1 hypothetical protein GE061_008179 [Apolygus lucorum]KAF6198432.1 hypothetical protein GE061_008180 [Apolygus lucorum]KAF6198433.1 hypothetical protein GE061_008181 [Apolygus lucorum]